MQTIKEAQAIRDKEWEARQSKETLLMRKLYKRYKIRLGSQEWIDCGDKARAERLSKFVAHFKKQTGITLTVNLAGPTHKPPYAISFLGLEG